MFTMPRLEHITITRTDTNVESLMDGFVNGPDRKIEGYALGESVFFTTDGRKVSQAKMKDIDWTKMQQEAHLSAVKNADEANQNGPERENFLLAREKVHGRPSSFVDQSGQWQQEDSFNGSPHESVQLYNNAWETALKNAQPDDLLMHWIISL